MQTITDQEIQDVAIRSAAMSQDFKAIEDAMLTIRLSLASIQRRSEDANLWEYVGSASHLQTVATDLSETFENFNLGFKIDRSNAR